MHVRSTSDASTISHRRNGTGNGNNNGSAITPTPSQTQRKNSSAARARRGEYTNGYVMSAADDSPGYARQSSGRLLTVPASASSNFDMTPTIATPPTAAAIAIDASITSHLLLAMRLSLFVNFLLFSAKTYSAIVSHSLSVGASAGESFLDLASELIVVVAERKSKQYDRLQYPVGRSRLEPIGIVLCASLMSMAALKLIFESVEQLCKGAEEHDELDLNAPHRNVIFNSFTISLLFFNILAKLGLWIYCAAYAKYSPTLYTLSVDHRNDVMSNFVALVAATLSWCYIQMWAADPIGAILMSVYICWNWYGIAMEQIEMLVGKSAEPEYIQELRQQVDSFHIQLRCDCVRAWHFGGEKYIVELEVLLPADMTVRHSHDIAFSLQRYIESQTSVERCYVFVAYSSLPDGQERHQQKVQELHVIPRSRRGSRSVPHVQPAITPAGAASTMTS